jgi:hypothetical protein
VWGNAEVILAARCSGAVFVLRRASGVRSVEKNVDFDLYS